MKKIFIIVGPSGSGKTTLGNYLKKAGIPELVSHTTRDKREGEIDNISYYFVDKEKFDKIEKIEYSNYSGNYYCLSKKEVENKLCKYDKVFAITDINGLKQIKEKYPKETVSIFIKVTLDEMVKRMNDRGDSKKDIAKRISNAILNDEFKNEKYCDFTIRNDLLCNSIEKLLKIVLN